MSPYTERSISGALARNTFSNELVVAPQTDWTGYECDLLVVCKRTLRLIDVEVKISRADLKNDARKNKWWRHPKYDARWETRRQGLPDPPSVARPWPPKIWKHYYAMPAELWKPELLEFVQPNSGVLLVTAPKQRDDSFRSRYAFWTTSCARRAKPNRDAQPIPAADALDIARLCSLRMWDSYEGMDTGRYFAWKNAGDEVT